MRQIYILFFVFFLFEISYLNAQISPDCSSAIPICNNTPVNGKISGPGIDDFNGAQSTGCLEAVSSGIESNSAWYRFRTGASGELGFNIATGISEDWDFALYKTDDCSNLGAPVRCNFFDNNDQNNFIGVGEDPTGDTENIQYEDWLQVEQGEDYYLLINNFSGVNSGFSVQFSGNIFETNPFDALDCSIVSSLLGPPIAACSGDTVILDASESNAAEFNWFIDDGTGFQLINAERNATLQVVNSAMYRVAPEGTGQFSTIQVTFSEIPTVSMVLPDSSCSSESYDLSIKNSEVLGGQNPDDFVVSYYTSLLDADNAINSLPLIYTSQTIGLQTIYIRVSPVENPNCFVLAEFEFTNLQSPELNFPEDIFVCENQLNVSIGAETANLNYEYKWSTGETTSSIDVSQTGTYTLIITNNVGINTCAIVRSVDVVFSKAPTIVDVDIQDLNTNNTVTVFTDIAGDWEYKLGNSPFQSENTFLNVSPGSYTLTVNDPAGCGSDSQEIVVVGFAAFFSPNGDGANDLWNIAGLSSLQNGVVHVYDRYGKLVKQIYSNDAGWDGSLGGIDLPSADYWFKLTYVDNNGQTAEAKYINNHFTLKR